MSTLQWKFALGGVLFLFIFLLGFWLSRSGRPYNQFIFTLHKLIALGAIVLLAQTAYQANQALRLSPLQIAVICLTALCFAAVFATGAVLSAAKAVPLIVQRLHQVLPYLTLLSTSASLFLLLVKSSEVLKTLPD